MSEKDGVAGKWLSFGTVLLDLPRSFFWLINSYLRNQCAQPSKSVRFRKPYCCIYPFYNPAENNQSLSTAQSSFPDESVTFLGEKDYDKTYPMSLGCCPNNLNLKI